MSETPTPHRAKVCDVEGVERAPLTEAQLREAFEIEGGQDCKGDCKPVDTPQPAPPVANPGNVPPDPKKADRIEKSGLCELQPVDIDPHAAALLLQALSVKTAENGRLMAEVERLERYTDEAAALLEQARDALYSHYAMTSDTDIDTDIIERTDRLLGLESVGDGDS